MRKKIIAGNWKMNNTLAESVAFINEIKAEIDTEEVDVVVCPNALSTVSVVNLLEGTNIATGVQNVSAENKGAFTGETSAEMVVAAGVKYAIVGHSERRQQHNETNQMVNLKVLKCLEKGITPIMCVGETLEQRQQDMHFIHIRLQIEEGLKRVENPASVVIAYEPIWAIGTGVCATEKEAEEMCKYIRNVVAGMFSQRDAEAIRIQYGGSVTKDNAKTILNMPNIDGALVGGASLKRDFIDIVHF